MAKIKIGLACSLLLVSTLACYSNLFAPPAPSPTPRPIVSVAELQFKDPETGSRFRALERCTRDLVDNSWRTIPPRLLGNFYSLKWCRGAGARDDCQITSSTIDHRDQRAIELNTLFYPQDYPEVFGLEFHSLRVPESTGWGVSHSFAEGGERILGEGWYVTFRKYVTPTGPAEVMVYLASDYSYTIVYNQTIFDHSSDPMLEDLAVYLSAPEAMRDRGLMHNQALARKVFAAINTHQVITCEQGPYIENEGGAEPACTPRPLTPEEEAVERARAEAYFADQEQLLRADYQEMYAAWMEAFPFDQCWPQ